jgi:TRAP-type C4-dicarboxylate transport system permease small subunit
MPYHLVSNTCRSSIDFGSQVITVTKSILIKTIEITTKTIEIAAKIFAIITQLIWGFCIGALGTFAYQLFEFARRGYSVGDIPFKVMTIISLLAGVIFGLGTVAFFHRERLIKHPH